MVSMHQPQDTGAGLYQQSLAIPCPFGVLEGRMLFTDAHHTGPGAVICPPHPLLAGNMDNNVITAIASTLARHCPVLLFNYRGVGDSDSPQNHLPLFELWKGIDATAAYGEIVQDLRTILAYSARLFQGIHLVGYSFGSYIALEAINDSVESFTAITPPLTEHDYSALFDLTIPNQVLLAEKDTLLGVLPPMPASFRGRCIHFPASDHFFRNREQELATRILSFICEISETHSHNETTSRTLYR
jgi:alpha/beta superfamily hydrolase